MATTTHVIEHDLSDELAKKATEKAFETYAAKFKDYAPTAKWVSDTKSNIGFEAKGVKLNGTIELKPKKLVLALDFPFFLKPFQSRAISVIDEEIRDWIKKAKNGEV